MVTGEPENLELRIPKYCKKQVTYGEHHMIRDQVETWYSPRYHLRYYSLVFIGNHLFIVGIGPILNRELEFIYRSDQSDRTCVYSKVSVL